jgi:pimeloyl-ACP methyl ester carboxylesterase
MLVSLAAATLAACGGSAPLPAPTPSSPSTAENAPDPTARCGFAAPAKKVVVTTDDGVKLAAAELGAGPHGIVLVHQHGADLCGWATFVRPFLDAGYHLLAIDLRCNGYSDCDPRLRGGRLRRDVRLRERRRGGRRIPAPGGATKVVLMGASLGAATVFVAGGRYPDRVDAIVSLSLFSSTFNVSGSGDPVRSAEDAASKITSPVLIGYAQADASSISRESAKALIAQTAAKATSKVVEGYGHGWELLNGGQFEIRCSLPQGQRLEPRRLAVDPPLRLQRVADLAEGGLGPRRLQHRPA